MSTMDEAIAVAILALGLSYFTGLAGESYGEQNYTHALFGIVIFAHAYLRRRVSSIPISGRTVNDIQTVDGFFLIVYGTYALLYGDFSRLHEIADLVQRSVGWGCVFAGLVFLASRR